MWFEEPVTASWTASTKAVLVVATIIISFLHVKCDDNVFSFYLAAGPYKAVAYFYSAK